MPVTARDLLLLGAARIEQPGGWTQRQFARNASGDYVDPLATSAVCFCPLGVMLNLMGNNTDAFETARTALDAYCDEQGDDDTVSFNDKASRTAAQAAQRMRDVAARLELVRQ